MHLDYLISDLALILIVAAIVTLIFKKINQPVVLGYIVAGFLISPNFIYMPTVVESADIHVWANIGVVFLMFGLGLEFSFRKIATVGGSAFVIALTVMSAMIIIGAGVGSMMGWDKMDCIFLGGMLSMSSTMIILKAYEEYDLKKKKFAQIVLGTLVVEDIAGIFMMIILTTISVSRNVSGAEMVTEIGMMLVYLAIWLLLGIYMVPTILKKIARFLNDEMTLIVSVGFCMGMVVIANLIGFSSALGAFMAGSILAGTVQVGKIERIISPIKDLFGAIFFVSVGMLIEPDLLVEYIGPIIIITLVTIVGQMLFSTAGILLSGQPLNIAVKGGFSMVQIGEFSFIVATLGMSLGVISDFLFPIIVCVSVITTFTTPVFIKNADKAYAFIDKKMPAKVKAFIVRNTSENQSDSDKNKDWMIYIRKVLLRTLLCSLMLFVIYMGGKVYLAPMLHQMFESDITADIIMAIVLCIIMAPFVNFMHGTNRALFTKLWLSGRSNKLPLLTLKAIRVIISACFVALVLKEALNIPFLLLVLIAFIPTMMLIRSDYLNGKTINLELTFIANFSEKILAREKKERGIRGEYHWLNESLQVAEFQVVDTVENKNIYDFAKSKGFIVTIIKIIRGEQYINMPSGDEQVLEGDILHMLGTADEIEACTMLLENRSCIEYTDREDVMLKDYIYGQTFYGIKEEQQLICCPIIIDKDSEFLKKSIKNCGLREKYRGTVIGIERGNLPIINPDIDTILQQGDLVWVIGSKRMADTLIKCDVLHDPSWSEKRTRKQRGIY
ncbi:MAG: cation:proton antiporter [Bacillota bacterium]|nr:cation:proton antiporter [Bacillota bacterium]